MPHSRNPWTIPLVPANEHTLSRFWKRRITMLARNPHTPNPNPLRDTLLFSTLAAAILALPMLIIVPLPILRAQEKTTQEKPARATAVTVETETLETSPPAAGGIANVIVEEVEEVTHNTPAKPQVEFLPEPSPKEQELLKILATPLDLPFSIQQETLQGVIDQLLTRLKIQIHADRKALEENAIGMDTPEFDLEISDVSPQTLLNLLLDSKDLAYSIEDGILKITTKEALNQKKRVYVYPVGDLVATREDLNELLNTIGSTLSTLQSANEFQGGTFSINSATRTLVATHNEPSHREVLKLLRALRQAATFTSNTPLPRSGESSRRGGGGGITTTRTISPTTGFGGGGGLGGAGLRRRDEDDDTNTTRTIPATGGFLGGGSNSGGGFGGGGIGAPAQPDKQETPAKNPSTKKGFSSVVTDQPASPQPTAPQPTTAEPTPKK